MNLKKIRDLYIAKSTFFYTPEGINIEGSIDNSKWVEYIDNHSDYFIWSENTEEGKDTLANIDKVPENFREKILRGFNKKSCYAEYNDKKGYYDIYVGFFLNITTSE